MGRTIRARIAPVYLRAWKRINSIMATTSPSCVKHIKNESVDLICLDPPFNSRGRFLLTPLQGSVPLFALSHGLRRGLHSFAASRLLSLAAVGCRQTWSAAAGRGLLHLS